MLSGYFEEKEKQRSKKNEGNGLNKKNGKPKRFMFVAQDDIKVVRLMEGVTDQERQRTMICCGDL